MSRLRGIALLAALIAAAAVSDTCQTGVGRVSDTGLTPVRHRSDTPPTPILVLVSFDGWRWDYIDRFPTPNLRALAARGARADRLIPSFPPLTFPNHYTLVTGLYPAHHGIVANTFRDPAMPERFTMGGATAKDPAWWRGEPIWVTAINQGRRAAAMFWPGTEAPIAGVRPTFWRPYDKAVPSLRRVEQVLEWLSRPEGERPALVAMYFDEVDTAAHDFGIDAPELTSATAHLDAALGQLIAGLARSGLADRTTVVVVSDHGMTQLSDDRVILLDDYIDVGSVNLVEADGFLALAPKSGDANAVYARLHGKHPALAIYRRDEVPRRLHYRGSPRIEPIIGIPSDGWTVTTRARVAQRHLATHGFDPRDRSMGAMFVAAGPGIGAAIRLPAFENVDVYNFLCDVLQLKPAKNDGSNELVRRVRR
jgi:predicted AlkP superfamily pyrophosphatase or phosphodiesterase